MLGRTRYFVALAFVALFALLPAPDAATGKPYLAYLRVREWLLDPVESPLQAWVQDGRLPELQVELRQSPPIEDPALLRSKQAEYARTAREWAAVRSQEGTPTTVDPDRGTLLLQVLVGTDGVQAQVATPTGGTAKLERPFASRWSLLPACLAIVIAVLTQRVLLALLAGGLAGAIAYVATARLGVVPDAFEATTGGVVHFFADALWRRSLCEDFYLRITLFVVFLFMMIGVITKNGGVHGMVQWLQQRVHGPVSAQLCSFATGLLIFFDDYSNCLVAGTTMRPLCDAARVSREKLAYIVDSTAAPVAGLSIVSTWITYEISQYQVPLTQVTKPDGTPYAANEAFAVFVDTLPYRFYCIFTLVLVFLVAVLRRDLGPMLIAERRARLLGKPFADDAQLMVAIEAEAAEPAPATPRRAVNAIVPLIVLVLGTLGTMFYQGASVAFAPATAQGLFATLKNVFEHALAEGLGATLRVVLGRASSDVALFWASVAAFVTAVLLTLAQRILSVREILRIALRSTRALGLAFGILFLAWSLGHVCKDLGTSFFLTAAARGSMHAAALPLLLFLLAGLISFATGTSFGTMAILLPNVVILAHQIGTETQFTGSAAAGGTALMLLCIGAVLEGSIFGDHCSPISDTTVLSSLGSQCDHMAHVTTQMPYALLAMATSALFGYLPMVLIGPQWWPLSLAVGIAAMAAVLLLCGRNPAASPTSSA